MGTPKGKTRGRKKAIPAATEAPVVMNFAKLGLSRSQKKWLYFTCAIIMAIVLGALTFWQIFEYDAFYLSRAGQLIVERRGFTFVEEWSHTVKGQPWYHFQWLASIIMYEATVIAKGWSGLVWLRSFSVGILFLMFGVLIDQVQKLSLRTLLTAVMLFPWIYLMIWLRLQMRPDLFAIICFTALVGVQNSAMPLMKKRWLGVGTLFLWSQLHTGTVPMGIFIFGLYQWIATGDSLKAKLTEKLTWSVLALACWFLTPLHYHILEVLSLNYQSQGNPDLQPMALKFFNFSEGGWTYLLWIPYTFFGVWGTFLSSHFTKSRQQQTFAWIGGIVYTAFFMHRIRTIPYQVIFLMPYVVLAIQHLGRLLERDWFKPSLVVALTWCTFLWGYAVPYQKNNISVALGAEVSKQWNPVDAVAFMKKNRPQRELLNHYNFGGYLVGELPEYPVTLDGRELPFYAIEREMNEARQTPEEWGSFLLRHNINVVMDKTPETQPIDIKGIKEGFAKIYPKEKWALIYLDQLAIIYVRRIPEHQGIIDSFENKGGILGGFGSSGRSFREGEIDQLKNTDPNLYNSIKDVLEDVKRRSHAPTQ